MSVVKLDATKGMSFARAVIALALTKGKNQAAQHYAAERWPQYPEITGTFKSAIESGQLGGIYGWGGQLGVFDLIATEYLTVVRSASVWGRLAKREVPLRGPFAIEQTPPVARWIGQGQPKSLTSIYIGEQQRLEPKKVQTIIVRSGDLLRLASGERETQQSLVDAAVFAIDRALLDPDNAPDAPASLTSQGTLIPSSGSTAALIAGDLRSMLVAVAANGQLVSPVWVMSPLTAAKLALLRDAQGGFAFPSVNWQGGTLAGIPILTSNATLSQDSPTEDRIILVDGSCVIGADDGQISVDVSDEAALQMDTAPASGAQQLVSMWQLNHIALKLERFLNWTTTRASCTAHLRVTF